MSAEWKNRPSTGSSYSVLFVILSFQFVIKTLKSENIFKEREKFLSEKNTYKGKSRSQLIQNKSTQSQEMVRTVFAQGEASLC